MFPGKVLACFTWRFAESLHVHDLIFNRLMPVCGDEVDLEQCGGVLHLHGAREESCLVHLARLNMRLNEDNGHCRKQVKVRIPEITVA